MTTPTDTMARVEELRAALALHGITLPSLRVDLATFASPYRQSLVALGNCNPATAGELAAVLRKAAER